MHEVEIHDADDIMSEDDWIAWWDDQTDAYYDLLDALEKW